MPALRRQNTLEIPPEQMVGTLFDDFLNKEDLPIVRDMFEKAVGDHEENVPPIEFRTVGKDGRTAHLEALVSNMLDEPGLKGLVANCRDISERKKLELDLTQAQRTEAVGKLAGGIAHDFNNILSSLIGFTELALDDAKLGVDPQKNLREVVNAGVRASELVKQILSFSGQEVERAQSFRVGDVAQEATDLLRAALPTTIDIRRTIDSEYSMVGGPDQNPPGFHEPLHQRRTGHGKERRRFGSRSGRCRDRARWRGEMAWN